MRYFSQEPPPPLGNFIHSFWESSYSASHPKLRVLPRGTAELVINLSEDEIRIYDSGSAEYCRRFPGIVVSGAYGGALDIDPMQNASMMGIHFRPGGAFPFFGGALGEITGSHIPLEALWGRLAVELRERLCAAATRQKRFQILEEAIKARLRWKSEHPAVSRALGILGSTGAGDSVGAIAARVGLSQRRFIELFTAQVGLTPKLFGRVLRFQRARQFAHQAAKPNWSQVALTCGFYDQSHLIHDFQEFSGLSPADYFRLSTSELSPNLVYDHVIAAIASRETHDPLIG